MQLTSQAQSIPCPTRPGYFTSVTVRATGTGTEVEIGRDGKGDTLRFDPSVARRRMAPVRMGEHTVAFLGLPQDADPQVSWGLDWVKERTAAADYFVTEEEAYIALAQRFLV